MKLPFISITLLFTALFQATGQGRKALLLSLLRKGIIDVPLMILMNILIPMTDLMMVQPILDFLCAAIAFALYLSFLKKAQKAFQSKKQQRNEWNMNIKWFGQSCFRITAENGTKIVMDPVKLFCYKLPEIDADIVTVSHNHSDHNNVGAVKGDFALIKDPGVFSQEGIDIKGIPTFHDNVSGAKRGKNIVYTFRIDGLNVCHSGRSGKWTYCSFS